MKKILLLILLWSIVGSVNVIAGQGDAAYTGGASGMHEARFNVFNYSTGKPLPNAGLYTLLDKQIGITNNKGILIVSLPASVSDIYVVKSEGFDPINVRLTQAEKKSADYEIFLKPAMTQDGDIVKVYVKQDPTSYHPQDDNSDVEFAVQISASSKPFTDQKSLNTWEELGHVYVHKENGLYKVRIGPFETQENAKAVLLKAKARGKNDAFIVVQKGIENHKPYEFPKHDDVTTNEVVKEEPQKEVQPVVENKEEIAEVVTGDYKVRLASYLHPGAFSTKDVDQYGPLESYRQGEWTIMLIGGFKTEADAMRVKNAVKTKGFVDAAVVVDHDGLLEETE